jgi:hypothetical protein
MWPMAAICAAADPTTEDTIAPDPEAQSLIDRYYHAQRWTPELYQHLTALHDLAKEKQPSRRTAGQHGPPVLEEQRHVIRQAAHYFSQRSAEGDRANEVLQSVSTRGVFKYLMGELNIDEYRVMAAVLPYIDTKDERLRRFIVTEVLEGDGRNTAVERDQNDPVLKGVFQYLTYNVQRAKLDPPWSLVQILYWKAPSVAVHKFSKSRDKSRDLLWAEHLIQDVLWKKGHGFLKPGDIKAVIEELEKLSQVDDWAVKLYVAEMLRRHEEFRDSRIIERLRNDKNSLVSKALDVPYRAEEKNERGLFAR